MRRQLKANVKLPKLAARNKGLNNASHKKGEALAYIQIEIWLAKIINGSSR